MVKVGRLIPVCLGLISGSFATEAGVDAQANSFSSLTKSGSIHTGGICDPGELASTFCNSSSYIYTYPGPSKPNSQKNKPRFHLFGDIISVSIPGMMRRTMEVENSAETLGFVSNEQSNSFELRDNVSVNSGHSEGSRTGRDQSPRSPPDGIPADLDTISSDGTDGYIEYEIKSQNSNEHWNVYRRFLPAIPVFSF